MSKQKKVRVDLRKNRQKRKRANDLTRDYQGKEHPTSEAAPSERVRAKGELSRKRTVIIQEGADCPSQAANDAMPGASLAVDLSECLTGRVLKIHGLESLVQTEDGLTYRCGVRRLLKTLEIEGRNVVAVGDRVWFRKCGGEQGVIENVDVRHGTVARGYRKKEHILVSNVDTLLIVSAFVQPELKLPLIDRYIVSAEKGGVTPIIVLNKADLVDLAGYQWVIGLYRQIGYEVVPTSAPGAMGLDRLSEILRQGTTALSGQSGVGKSSLLNAIEPGLDLRIGSISDQTAKGKHTTTHAELLRLSSGGYVVDTPGLRQFELWDVEPWEIESFFIEFRSFIPQCRFPDCSHSHERSCAVKDAVYFGLIDEGRYQSYLKMYAGKPLTDE